MESQYCRDDLARPTLDQLNDRKWLGEQIEHTYGDWVIGVDSDPWIWPLAIDLHHLLMEQRRLFDEPRSWLGCTLLEDMGISTQRFGNAGGGAFSGDHRSLLVEDQFGERHSVSFIVAATSHLVDDPVFRNQRGRTYLNVAVSDAHSSHNSLELCLDSFVEERYSQYAFWHDGRMTVGNRGRIPNAEVLEYITERQASLVAGDLASGRRVSLGTIPRGKLLEWEYVSEVIQNMAVYALLRDELRQRIGTSKHRSKR